MTTGKRAFAGTSQASLSGAILHVEPPPISTVRPLAEGEVDHELPQILPRDDGDPDGRWIAYQSNESGEEAIHVRPFPDVNGGHWQVATESGRWPVWRPDGRGLFYGGLRGMMAAPINTAPTLTIGTPQLLFDTSRYVLALAVGASI